MLNSDRTWSEDTSIFNWQKASSQRCCAALKKRVAFGLRLKSGSGGATRSGVEEKIRQNSLRFGLRHLFRFFLPLRYALRGWVTRALQGKVLLLMRVSPLARVAEHLRQMNTLRITANIATPSH